VESHVIPSVSGRVVIDPNGDRLIMQKFDYLADIGRYCRQRADLIGVLVLKVMKK
jgi:hypothetical protein